MFNLLEPGHLIPILLVALIVFGPKRLPELGKSIGGALREFRRGTQGLKEEFEQATHDQPRQAEKTLAVPPSAAPVMVISAAQASIPASEAGPAVVSQAVVSEAERRQA